MSGAHISVIWAVCLGQWVSVFCKLLVREESVVALHLYIGPLKHLFWVGAGIGRERNVLFNDALNTFYLRLYGVRHMVKDHSDSEKGNPLPPHGLLFSISSKGSFICTIPQKG